MKQAFAKQAPQQSALSRLSGNGHNNGTGDGSNNSDSPRNGKGNEIYGTIRNVAPATAVAASASAHARDRALHGQDSPGPASPLQANRRSPNAAPAPNIGETFAPGEVGMDDVILDTVIIPAIESVSREWDVYTALVG